MRSLNEVKKANVKEKAFYTDGEIFAAELYFAEKIRDLAIIANKIVKGFRNKLKDRTLRSKCYNDKILVTSDKMGSEEIEDLANDVADSLKDKGVDITQIDIV
jgi:hypothetical protein